jgi:hypothetical protein
MQSVTIPHGFGYSILIRSVKADRCRMEVVNGSEKRGKFFFFFASGRRQMSEITVISILIRPQCSLARIPAGAG